MIRTAIVTVSDSVAAGMREDRSGAVLRARVEAQGWQVTAQEIVPDDVDRIANVLTRLADSGQVSLILTTGGTGIAARDVTPEAARTVIVREIPGLGEMMRAEGRKLTPFAALSRSMAGVRGRVLIVGLPGSPKGALESLDAIVQLIPHIIDLIEGRTGHGNVPN
ncbi:MAG: MogA/MoaB family molybdenum cofactor biosynthesis protein [Bryobacteraceae bacterium]|jgi:molybdenum cofactor synthesis domain-containing protein